jgi:methionyl-tRNA formyltransferase
VIDDPAEPRRPGPEPNIRPMRILYLGSGAFGIPTLAQLHAEHTVVGIVTQPDRPAGRGSALTPTPVAAWAAEHAPGVRVFKPEKVNEPAVAGQIRDLAGPDSPGGIDAWVVIAFGQKLGRALMSGGAGVPPAPLFAINLHASLLPRWRGAAPINAAILAGDAVTGNSVIALADKMDAGVVYAQSRRPIDPAFTSADLHDLLAADGPALVESVLAAHGAGRDRPFVQDDARVTLAGKLAKSDGWVDFGEPAATCRNRIHGLNPWPTVTATLLGEPLKLLRARAHETPHPHTAPRGALIDPSHGLVACGPVDAPSTLELIEVQPANKRPMPWPDFARGRKFPPGPVVIDGGRSGGVSA